MRDLFSFLNRQNKTLLDLIKNKNGFTREKRKKKKKKKEANSQIALIDFPS